MILGTSNHRKGDWNVARALLRPRTLGANTRGIMEIRKKGWPVRRFREPSAPCACRGPSSPLRRMTTAYEELPSYIHAPAESGRRRRPLRPGCNDQNGRFEERLCRRSRARAWWRAWRSAVATRPRGLITLVVGRSEGPCCFRARTRELMTSGTALGKQHRRGPYLGASSAMRSFEAFAIASPALISKALMATMTPMFRAGAKAT